MKRRTLKYIKVFFVALCAIAVIVGTMGCHTQETERQTDGAVQAQECSVFPKAESGVDLNDFFVADEEPEVDTYGDFDLQEYLNACGWDRNYTRPEYGEYAVDSSLFEGAHASLTLDGYEHTMFVIRDICGLALVRIESDYPHERVRIVDSDHDEISSEFLIVMNEVFDCIREAEDADSLEKSLEVIRASYAEISVLTYEEAEALFPEGPEVEHEVRNWYNELSNTFDLSAFLANYGWGDDDINYASYGLRKISSDNGTIYLRLDPREAAFVVDAGGIVAEGVWDVSESESVRIPRIGENAPKSLLVALNAVLDRVTKGCHEDDLEAFEVEHMTVKLCGNMEDTSVSKMLNPEARHVIEIGGKQIATVNSVDDWRLDPTSPRLVPELMFDSFDLSDYSDWSDDHMIVGYRYDTRLNMWAEDEDAINAFSLELLFEDGSPAYQIIVKRFGDKDIVETTDEWNASRDLLDILIFTLEEWRYERTELGDHLMEFADGNGLGDSLYLEVVQFQEVR